MDIALGVSMTPTTVRMVLVEGENADGVTVDHDVFDIDAAEASATAPEQVLAAILGTRESAAEGGHRLASTGVTWRDHDDAARLKEALAARHIDDVLLVSELHAAGTLAQAAGRSMGYQRTALLFLDGDTATLSVVDNADGSIVRVERQDLHTEDAVAQLTAMVGALEHLEAAPQGVFVVGSGVSAAALKPQLEAATSLPVQAPEEPGLALARGAALAGARAPMFEAATIARSYAAGDEGPTAGSALAYSEVIEDPLAVPPADLEDVAEPEDFEPAPAPPRQRKPILLVGSAMTGIFVLGVAALVVSLAVSIRPTVDQRPSPAESVIVPTQAPAPAAAVPVVPVAPAPPPETIQAPIPVVQEAPAPAPQAPPRTVFVEAPAPAPEAPAPAPAAPAPAPAAPAPVPEAPAPAPVVAPPAVIPAPIVVPQLPLIQWPWERQTTPKRQYPRQYPQQQQQQPQWYPPAQQQQPQWDPSPPQNQWQPDWNPPVQQQQPQWDPPQQQWPGRDRGSDDAPSSRSPGRSGNDGNSQWPWPSWGDGWDN